MLARPLQGHVVLRPSMDSHSCEISEPVLHCTALRYIALLAQRCPNLGPFNRMTIDCDMPPEDSRPGQR